jgi:hypothetical protein
MGAAPVIYSLMRIWFGDDQNYSTVTPLIIDDRTVENGGRKGNMSPLWQYDGGFARTTCAFKNG